MKFLTVPLNSKHKKKEFSCGKEILDNYLHKQANQDVKRKLSACFVFEDKGSNIIRGYYTLSNYSIPHEDLPEEMKAKLPKSYISIPAILLGRLAVDLKFVGKGYGKGLLVDALRRSLNSSTSIGSYCLIVDPLDDEAESFYDKFGFIKIPGSGKMLLAMKTIQIFVEFL